MGVMVPLYVHTTTFIQGRVEAVKQHRDRGAPAIEYIGIIILAAVIIAGLWAAFKDTQWAQRVTDAVNSIFHTGAKPTVKNGG